MRLRVLSEGLEELQQIEQLLGACTAKGYQLVNLIWNGHQTAAYLTTLCRDPDAWLAEYRKTDEHKQHLALITYHYPEAWDIMRRWLGRTGGHALYIVRSQELTQQRREVTREHPGVGWVFENEKCHECGADAEMTCLSCGPWCSEHVAPDAADLVDVFGLDSQDQWGRGAAGANCPKCGKQLRAARVKNADIWSPTTPGMVFGQLRPFEQAQHMVLVVLRRLAEGRPTVTLRDPPIILEEV